MYLNRGFYNRPVLDVARALIGCYVAFDGCSGVIVETEAYHDSEPACHAFIGVTERTETLFGPPGIAYVYRSYGIHSLLNAVCEPMGVGAAVLIRALEPDKPVGGGLGVVVGLGLDDHSGAPLVRDDAADEIARHLQYRTVVEGGLHRSAACARSSCSRTRPRLVPPSDTLLSSQAPSRSTA